MACVSSEKAQRWVTCPSANFGRSGVERFVAPGCGHIEERDADVIVLGVGTCGRIWDRGSSAPA